MKGLSIEQKAKAYDKALEKARQLCAYPTSKPFISDLQDLFPELSESEDERIRKGIIQYLEQSQFGEEHYQIDDDIVRNYIAWLEKQGENAKFRDSIQVGDKVTRNQDGMLVNLSQLNRVAKKDEKKGDDKVEQKPWSEEDELCLTETLYLIRNSYSVDDKVERLSNWVKSIKDRLLPQLKQEWSEEDEIMHKTIILNLKVQMENCAVPSKDYLNKAIGWFQKLKHQKTFVPSEEEMKALEFCLEHNIDKDGVFGSKVVKLYKKLKKLTK